ncbi:FAD-dependent oxidoreductase [Shewanella mangrovi]|uniref:FAD-dependent oxidoreductase n=1 Tax=Shewanella mangrovi TaxID=1515746 RepID=A0A094JG85_9GAMM|nr:FAD-dependent oxidoreductase [Shewanella mangrovi]KFZ37044.1 FAD-dependent oxidoreductase [Shewanella mangrovi]
MSHATTALAQKRIAIIGSGISSLTCGYLLSKQFDITLFEANTSLGGHTATVDIEAMGKQYAIDTGFIVFNDRTYPRFQKLLAQLDVEILPTEMSFSVRHLQSGLEYNGHSFRTLFAQKRNLIEPQFWGFLLEIMRFNKRCKTLFTEGIYPDDTLGEFLRQEQFSAFFCEHYILPMGAAIWSASLQDIEDFPLRFFIEFFQNHGLLDVRNRPQWYVIKGGSRSYIPHLIKPFADKVHLNAPVQAVRRHQDGVELLVNGGWQGFDEVIIGCHSDQASALLADADFHEKQVLGALPYQDNEVVLHLDTRLLPQQKAAWASWNYRLDGDRTRPAAVTYNMNILQRLPSDAPNFLVTLNQSDAIDERKILRRFNYSHPQFSMLGLRARQQREQICGKRHTHFVGAYWYNGFHEDGVHSALDVCQRFGVHL